MIIEATIDSVNYRINDENEFAYFGEVLINGSRVQCKTVFKDEMTRVDAVRALDILIDEVPAVNL